MGKKAISILLALAMAVSIVCVSASAEGEEDLASAISEDGTLESGSYVLNSDVDLSEDIVIPAGADVTIDLAGNTLTGTGEGSVITVNGNLTLEDSVGTGKIIGGTGTEVEINSNMYYVEGGGVYVASTSASSPATFTMNGGTISGNTCKTEEVNGVQYIGYGGGVFITGTNVTFNMNGGNITGNEASMGGGVAVYNSSSSRSAAFKMSDGTISQNTVANASRGGYGGGVYCIDGAMQLLGGTVEKNEAVNGGGVYMAGTAQLVVKDAEVTGNAASNRAGGIFVNSNVKAYLQSAPTIIENTANNQASNLYLNNTTVTLISALTGNVGVTTATVPTEDATVQITTAETSTAYYADALANGAMTSDSVSYVVQANADNYLELAKATATFYGATLTLDGSIGVNFYVDMTGVDEEDMDSYSVKFDVDGKETSVAFDETAYRDDFGDGVTYYRYTVNVSSVQMTSTITATLLKDDESCQTVTYTVRKYCANAISEGWDTAELCRALLHYGGYAQVYFDSATENLANADDGNTLGLAAVDPVEYWEGSSVSDRVSGYAAQVSETMPDAIAADENGDHFGATLLLKSETVIRLYFNLADGYDTDDVTFTVDRETLTIQTATGEDSGFESYSYYVEVQVPANELSRYCTFTVAGADGTEGTVQYSAFVYANKIINDNSSDADLQNVCKALAFYGQAAENYADWY